VGLLSTIFRNGMQMNLIELKKADVLARFILSLYSSVYVIQISARLIMNLLGEMTK
jgi:hypothetical protein